MKKTFIRVMYFPLLIVYLELIFRLCLNVRFFSYPLLNILLFSLSYGLILFLSTMFLKGKLLKVALTLITLFLLFAYISQATVYLIYSAIYSFSLAGQAGAAFEFFTFVLEVIRNNWSYYILYLFPLVALILILRSKEESREFKKHDLMIVISVLLLLYSSNLILLPKKGMHSSYDLYYKINLPNMMTSRLGLATTMRLDVSRLIFGFEEESKLIDTGNEIIDEDDNKNEDEEEVEKQEYNMLEIDFDYLIENESNQNIIDLHNYFKTSNATVKNEMTGIFEGKNLIYILAESLDHIAIDENITPTLYKLSNEGLNFTNFYTPIFLSTIDGEYMSKTGLLPREGVWSLWRSRNNYLPFTLGNQFLDQGYKTTAIHNGRATYYNRHESHPNLGYQNYYACGQGLNINCSLWPQSDLEMIEKSKDFYIGDSPFFTYYLTISGHLRYNLYNQMAVKNWEYAKELPYSTAVRAYMAQHVELDRAIEKLINELDEKGVLSETVIAISSDHWPYGLTADQLNERSNSDRSDFFERDRLPFIVWNSESEGKEVDLLGSSVDITPTLLNMFGLEYDSRLLTGKDIFSNEEPIVVFSDRSWITNEGKYKKSEKEFYKNPGSNVDDEYVEKINNIVHNYFQVSRMVLDNNYYAHLGN